MLTRVVASNAEEKVGDAEAAAGCAACFERCPRGRGDGPSIEGRREVKDIDPTKHRLDRCLILVVRMKDDVILSSGRVGATQHEHEQRAK